MAEWRMKMERSMVELVSGNEERLENTRKIVSWFSSRKEMRRAVKKVFRNLTAEEDMRLTPNSFTTPSGAPVGSLAALVWAMEETEGANLQQRRKWWAFRSRRRFPTGPEEMVVGGVMAIPAPESRRTLLPLEHCVGFSLKRKG